MWASFTQTLKGFEDEESDDEEEEFRAEPIQQQHAAAYITPASHPSDLPEEQHTVQAQGQQQPQKLPDSCPKPGHRARPSSELPVPVPTATALHRIKTLTLYRFGSMKWGKPKAPQLATHGVHRVRTKHLPAPMDLFKLLILHVQSIMIIMATSIPWPNVLDQLQSSLNNILSSGAETAGWSFSAACMLPHADSMQQALLTQIHQLASPLVILVVVPAAWAVRWWLCRHSFRGQSLQRQATTRQATFQQDSKMWPDQYVPDVNSMQADQQASLPPDKQQQRDEWLHAQLPQQQQQQQQEGAGQQQQEDVLAPVVEGGTGMQLGEVASSHLGAGSSPHVAAHVQCQGSGDFQVVTLSLASPDGKPSPPMRKGEKDVERGSPARSDGRCSSPGHMQGVRCVSYRSPRRTAASVQSPNSPGSPSAALGQSPAGASDASGKQHSGRRAGKPGRVSLNRRMALLVKSHSSQLSQKLVSIRRVAARELSGLMGHGGGSSAGE